MKIKTVKNPAKLSSYWKSQLPLLLVISISGILFNVGMLVFPYFQGVVIDMIEQNTDKDKTIKIILLFVAVILLVQILRAIKRYTVRLFSNRTVTSMRYNIYNNILNQSEKELSEVSIGSLLSRCFSDAYQTVEGMRKLTTEIFDTVFVFIFYISFLMIFDYKMTLFALISVFASIFVAFLLRKKIYQYSYESRMTNSKVSEKTFDIFDNALLYRLYSRDEDIEKDYDETLKNHYKKNIKSLTLSDTMLPICNIISLIGIVVIIFLGSFHVINNDNLLMPLPFMESKWTVGMLSTYITTFVLLSSKASHTAKLFSSIEKGLSSWKRIKPYIEEIKDYTTAEEVKGDTLELDDFSLKIEDRTLIDHLSFKAKKGEIIGITGEIGCGKSAFSKVFLKLLPYQGEVKLFNKELNSYSDAEIAGSITYMGHQSQLFTMSIKDNIALGEDKDINEYLHVVSFDTDMENMKDKEDTIIGNQGVRLSGGQQQRIALARTLYHRKGLIILDDPFSSVDIKTENEIINSIDEWKKDNIIILISHRLSLFPRLDKVLVFHGDGNVSVGKHDDLLNTDELYQKLYSLQMRGEEK